MQFKKNQRIRDKDKGNRKQKRQPLSKHRVIFEQQKSFCHGNYLPLFLFVTKGKRN
jgi:hypothetical protein